LDLLSGGRVELGVGRSGHPFQLTPFGVRTTNSTCPRGPTAAVEIMLAVVIWSRPLASPWATLRIVSNSSSSSPPSASKN
jgi:hypothetical protein